MRKFSITTALILGTAVLANGADDLASAFKEGKLDGRLRGQYFATDWEANNKDNATGFALGGSLVYKTAPLYGVSFATGLYTTQNPGGWTGPDDGATAATAKDLFCRDQKDGVAGCRYGDGYAVLAQAYLQYNLARSTLKAGRILMNNPWITPNDTKMIPIAIEGAEIVSNDLPNTTLQFDYADSIKERGNTYFGNMADAGDTPVAIRKAYDTHYYVDSGRSAPNVAIAGATNKSIDNLELQGWVMNWPDLVDQLRIEANYAFEAGDLILGLGGVYMQQFDKGAGDLILPAINHHDSDNSVNTFLYAFRTTAHYRAAKLLLAASHTDEGGDIIAPWRGFPTQGYTRSMTQTDWTANTTAYKAEIDYDWHAVLPGVSTLLSYAVYDRDPGKKPYQSLTNRGYQNGDTRQWNFDIVYKLSGHWKGAELKARLMDQQNDTTALYTADTSNREMRLEANYRF